MLDLFEFIVSLNFPIRTIAIAPPRNETKQLRKNKGKLVLPVCIIETGSKPNRPKDFINNILPKTPAMVFPTRPKEYFLKINPVRFAPIIPIKMLIKEIKVSVI